MHSSLFIQWARSTALAFDALERISSSYHAVLASDIFTRETSIHDGDDISKVVREVTEGTKKM
jgi:hypothetical protein